MHSPASPSIENPIANWGVYSPKQCLFASTTWPISIPLDVSPELWNRFFSRALFHSPFRGAVFWADIPHAQFRRWYRHWAVSARWFLCSRCMTGMGRACKLRWRCLGCSSSIMVHACVVWQLRWWAFWGLFVFETVPEDASRGLCSLFVGGQIWV